MRFAYIDSQGNEVAIPSVEALGLRIELGAIGPDTQLYDGQADRWGPASSFEIFQTLSRGVTEEKYAGSPPPEAPPSDALRYDSEPVGPGAAVNSGGPPEEDITPAEAEPVFDLTEEFAAPAIEPEGAPPEEGITTPEAESVFDLSDELWAPPGEENPAVEAAEGGARPPEPEPRVTADDDLPLDLTLIDMGGPAGEHEDVGHGALPEDYLGSGGLPDGGVDATRSEGDSRTDGSTQPPPVSDLSEDTLDFSNSLDLAEGLDLEPPLSEFTPEVPAPLAGQEQEADDGEAMVFGPGQAEPPEAGDGRVGAPPPMASDTGRRERPTPRNRPSPPRPVKRRSPMGLVVGIVVVAVVGGGGWLGWHWYQSRGASGVGAAATTTAPRVTIPEIPAGLLPTMRDLGGAALATTIDRMGAMVDSLHLAAAPDSAWLAGVYMANAGRYGDVRDYWVGLRGLVDSMRAEDTHLFHDEYQKQLAATSLEGDTARLLLERADSGFLATRQDREAAYSLMDDLVTAALNLHQFLIDNESEIEYDPAAGGVSRDPVLEAVPKTKELGTQMWSRVDRITAALDALGTLDKVTTERLTAALFDRIRRAGFE